MNNLLFFREKSISTVQIDKIYKKIAQTIKIIFQPNAKL